ncbi:MAG: phosphotransferase [Woeseiaceae bacterium]
MDQRLEQLKIWLNDSGISYQDIQPASADASFRRYFRITDQGTSLIVMDAPPEKEDCQPFINIAGLLLKYGLNVPKILALDLNQGFILLNDLGNTVFLSELSNATVDKMYRTAMMPLLDIQKQVLAPEQQYLPHYNETLLRRELDLFPDWYLKQHKGITLSANQTSSLQQVFELLIKNALEQPQVCVHRDYHSRNLMVNHADPSKPGVIDFQDAVIGAVTYDLVSLLKDCYINWPREKVEQWVAFYYNEATALGILENIDSAQFLRWFDLMGLQRHLKVAGIFTRLKLRDGKTGYMKDIPRTMEYIIDTVQLYPELKPLATLLDDIL